jgi:hypothetical protein
LETEIPANAGIFYLEENWFSFTLANEKPDEMKKIFNLIVAIIFSVAVSAQTSVYHPFADSGAVWVMQWLNACTTGPPCVGTCTADYQYRIDGDTILSGNNYKKVIKEGFTVSTCSCITNVASCSGSTYYSGFYYGIRDDIANRKSYINNGIDPEELFFDFNLTVGDSVRNRFCYQKIVGIDSVLIGNDYRKSYTLESFGRVIEGIGYVDNNIYDGPFEWCGPCVCNDGWKLMCYRLNGVVLYGDTNCQLVTSVSEVQATGAAVELFPNPATNEFKVQSSKFKIESIEIFDVIGKKVYEMRLISDVQHPTVGTGRFPAGIYFVKIKGENTEVVVKLIKE